jgi:hypothetical protein
MQLRRVGLFAAVALVAVACGGDGDGGDSDGVAAPASAPSSATTATSVATPPPAPSSAVEVPDAVLTDVASGEEVSLRSMVPSERPVLFWFWAPH